MTDDPRPGGRRSWWLREALAREPDDARRPAVRGPVAADVAIVGGGYTGLWSAWFLTELAPGSETVLVLQSVFIYAPPMQAVFDSAALSVGDWLLALAAASTVLPVVGAEKWWRLRSRR